MNNVSIYIHIPFCAHRCGYCDFNTYAGLGHLIPDYVKCLCNEIEYLSKTRQNEFLIDTIYFGGGTPSLLKPSDVGMIISTINNNYAHSHNQEITLEANPGTVSKLYFSKLIETGVNRISLGMQSGNDVELKLLDRQHSFQDVSNAVHWAKEVGMNQINLDLIYGLPYQTLEKWLINIEAALSLYPDHLSLYALTIEQGTPLHEKILSKTMLDPDPDLAADMYESASERLSHVGYKQYEISNWAYVDGNRLNGFNLCRHNLQYWRNLPYLGFGAGAHGYIDLVRTVNVKSPLEFINRMCSVNTHTMLMFPKTPVTDSTTIIDRDTEIGETMMMGLRLVDEGVTNQDFLRRFGVSLERRFGDQIKRLIESGLLEWENPSRDGIRLTKRGRLLGNRVFREFI